MIQYLGQKWHTAHPSWGHRLPCAIGAAFASFSCSELLFHWEAQSSCLNNSTVLSVY